MDYISVYQGSTKTVNVNLTNPDGTPYNASGASLYLTVGRNYTDTTPLFSLATTGLGSNLTNALTGLMTFSLGTGETTLCAGTYPGSLLLVDVLSGRSPAAVGYIVTPIPLPPS
jgi:hypothetical protein